MLKVKKRSRNYCLYKILSTVFDRMMYLMALSEEIKYAKKQRSKDQDFITNLLLENSNFEVKKYPDIDLFLLKDLLNNFHEFILMGIMLYKQIFDKINDAINLSDKKQTLSPLYVDIETMLKVIYWAEKYSANAKNVANYKVTLKHSPANISLCKQMLELFNKALSSREKNFIKYISYKTVNNAYQEFNPSVNMEKFFINYSKEVQDFFSMEETTPKIINYLVDDISSILPFNMLLDLDVKQVNTYAKNCDKLTEICFQILDEDKKKFLFKKCTDISRLHEEMFNKIEEYNKKLTLLLNFINNRNGPVSIKFISKIEITLTDDTFYKFAMEKACKQKEQIKREMSRLKIPPQTCSLRVLVKLPSECYEILDKNKKIFENYLKKLSLSKECYYSEKAKRFFDDLKYYVDEFKKVYTPLKLLCDDFFKAIDEWENLIEIYLKKQLQVNSKKDLDNFNQDKSNNDSNSKGDCIINDATISQNSCSNNAKDSLDYLLKRKQDKIANNNVIQSEEELKKSTPSLIEEEVLAKTKHSNTKSEKSLSPTINKKAKTISNGYNNLSLPNTFLFKKTKDVKNQKLKETAKQTSISKLLALVVNKISKEALQELDKFCSTSVDACVKSYTYDDIKDLFKKIVGEHGKVTMKDGKHTVFKFGLDFKFTLSIPHGEQKSGGKILSRTTVRIARACFFELKSQIDKALRAQHLKQRKNKVNKFKK